MLRGIITIVFATYAHVVGAQSEGWKFDIVSNNNLLNMQAYRTAKNGPGALIIRCNGSIPRIELRGHFVVTSAKLDVQVRLKSVSTMSQHKMIKSRDRLTVIEMRPAGSFDRVKSENEETGVIIANLAHSKMAEFQLSTGTTLTFDLSGFQQAIYPILQHCRSKLPEYMKVVN